MSPGGAPRRNAALRRRQGQRRRTDSGASRLRGQPGSRAGGGRRAGDESGGHHPWPGRFSPQVGARRRPPSSRRAARMTKAPLRNSKQGPTARRDPHNAPGPPGDESGTSLLSLRSRPTPPRLPCSALLLRRDHDCSLSCPITLSPSTWAPALATHPQPKIEARSGRYRAPESPEVLWNGDENMPGNVVGASATGAAAAGGRRVTRQEGVEPAHAEQAEGARRTDASERQA